MISYPFMFIYNQYITINIKIMSNEYSAEPDYIIYIYNIKFFVELTIPDSVIFHETSIQ